MAYQYKKAKKDMPCYDCGVLIHKGEEYGRTKRYLHKPKDKVDVIKINLCPWCYDCFHGCNLK